MNNSFHSLAKYGIVCFLLCLFFSLSAQEVIDTAQYRAVYEFSYKTKPEQIEFTQHDVMFLDIGRQKTFFYSQLNMIRDSLKNQGIKQGLSAYEVVENLRAYKRGTSKSIYMLFDENKTVTTEVLLKPYFYEEPLTMPTWQIHNEENKMIAGFSCKKATTTYLGREWTVYFSTEIPFNYGPWKLWGLAGLILEARDVDNLFLFSLSGFEKLNDTIQIIHKYDTDNRFTKLSKKNYTDLEKLFYKDRHEFQKLAMPGTTIHMSKEQAEKYQKLKKAGGIPYIPLEP